VHALDGYSAVVLGGAIYMGRWHHDEVEFLKRNRQALAAMPLAIFAIGPKTTAEADVAASRSQLEHVLGAVPKPTPVTAAIFGGGRPQ